MQSKKNLDIPKEKHQFQLPKGRRFGSKVPFYDVVS